MFLENPFIPVPSHDQFDYAISIPITRKTWQRFTDFQRKHPTIDTRPIINERINDFLDEVERAENG